MDVDILYVYIQILFMSLFIRCVNYYFSYYFTVMFYAVNAVNEVTAIPATESRSIKGELFANYFDNLFIISVFDPENAANESTVKRGVSCSPLY